MTKTDPNQPAAPGIDDKWVRDELIPAINRAVEDGVTLNAAALAAPVNAAPREPTMLERLRVLADHQPNPADRWFLDGVYRRLARRADEARAAHADAAGAVRR